MTQQRDLFFSYASENRSVVEQLIAEIKEIAYKKLRRDLTYYFDQTDNDINDNLKDKIRYQISNSKYIAIVISRHYIDKLYPRLEAEYSLLNKKDNIIPIWMDVQENDVQRLSSCLSELLAIQLSNESVSKTAREILIKIFPESKESLSINNTKILISNESPFTKELCNALCKKMEVKTENLYVPTTQTGYTYEKAYSDGLDIFLADEETEWLYSVLYEEKNYVFTKEKAIDLIEKLNKRKKKIIFFESGMNFIELVKDKDEKPIFVIKTNHKYAVVRLIKHILDEYLRNNTRIHFITILGPRESPAAIERRTIFNDFLSQLVKNRGLKDCQFSDYLSEPDLPLRLNIIETLQVTSLSIDSWSSTDAQEVIKKNYSNFSLLDNTLHHCFLCGNDDIVLGVRAAICDKSKKETKDLNISFIGYDGISDMIDLIKSHHINAATIKVFINQMCDKALEIKRGKKGYTVESLQQINGDIVK